jgi:hypothetical protein
VTATFRIVFTPDVDVVVIGIFYGGKDFESLLEG